MIGLLDLFREAKVEVKEPEPTTSVRLGTRVAEVNLRKRRREALEKLMEILTELEGKDIYIGHNGGMRGLRYIGNTHGMFSSNDLP